MIPDTDPGVTPDYYKNKQTLWSEMHNKAEYVEPRCDITAALWIDQ